MAARRGAAGQGGVPRGAPALAASEWMQEQPLPDLPGAARRCTPGAAALPPPSAALASASREQPGEARLRRVAGRRACLSRLRDCRVRGLPGDLAATALGLCSRHDHPLPAGRAARRGRAAIQRGARQHEKHGQPGAGQLRRRGGVPPLVRVGAAGALAGQVNLRGPAGRCCGRRSSGACPAHARRRARAVGTVRLQRLADFCRGRDLSSLIDLDLRRGLRGGRPAAASPGDARTRCGWSTSRPPTPGKPASWRPSTSACGSPTAPAAST